MLQPDCLITKSLIVSNILILIAYCTRVKINSIFFSPVCHILLFQQNKGTPQFYVFINMHFS